MPTDAQLPALLTPAQISKACGMSRRAAKTMLRGAGILERIGERWYVGETRLRERLPDVYDRVYEAIVFGGALSFDDDVRDADWRRYLTLEPAREPSVTHHQVQDLAPDSIPLAASSNALEPRTSVPL